VKPISAAMIAAMIAAVLATASGSSAFADKVRCTASPGSASLPIEKAIEKSESLGYAVREIKRSKGCWKIEGHDRNGVSVEFYLDPVSGEIVKPASWRAPAR